MMILQAGLIAATLIAVSNWGVYMARGTWHPTYNEVGAVLALALFVKGLLAQRNALIVYGFLVCGLVAGGGMEGFALPLQAGVATTLAGLWRGKWRGAWLGGMAICVGSGLIYLAALYISGQFGLLLGNGLVSGPAAQLSDTQRAARDVTQFNQDVLGHFLRLVTNADYGLVWTHSALRGYALKETVGQVQAMVLSVLVGIGVIRWGLRGRALVNRFLVVWGGVLIAVLYLLIWRNADTRVPPYYLLTVSPLPHLAVATALVWLLDRMRVVQMRTSLVLACCGALAILPCWNFVAAAQNVYGQKLISAGFAPLRWNKLLGDQWRVQCSQMTGVHEWWELSMMQSAHRIVRGNAHSNAFSSIHAGTVASGDCVLRQAGRVIPNSEPLTLTLEEGSVIQTDRALPYVYTGQPTMTANIGWTLLDYSARALSPDTITVRQVWRIDTLPNEPYHHWYFAPYAKLIAPDGRMVAQFDSAVSMEGWEWQLGSIVISEAELSLPADLPAGRYTVQTSLYDPNQQKNAVYFVSAEPSKPILALEKTIDLPAR